MKITAIVFVFLACGRVCSAQLPSDVRPDHWAAASVQSALDNGVLTAKDVFNGSKPVTQQQAVIALANAARKVEARRWKPAKSQPLSDSVAVVMPQLGWRSKPINRYMLASILTRAADYIVNSNLPPPVKPKDAGKSTALPPPAKVTLSRTDPAYTALVYLASHRLVQPGSPLLKPTAKPITGEVLSGAVAEWITGINDRLTELGFDEDGSTPDAELRRRDRERKAHPPAPAAPNPEKTAPPKR